MMAAALTSHGADRDPRRRSSSSMRLRARPECRLRPTFTAAWPNGWSRMRQATPHVDPEGSFVLEPPSHALLDDVVLRAVPRSAPGPGQIEVRIDAIGLNYKDSMKLLGVLTPQNLRGLIRDDHGNGGHRCRHPCRSRTRFRVGDDVLVSVPDMFSRYSRSIRADVRASNALPDV